MPRIALIFDNKVRPDTTGMYCRRALLSLADVHHYLPSELDRIPRTGFDLYLFIDDGLRHPIPDDLRPAAYWAIDTHLDFEWGLEQSRRADFAFAAQRDGAERLRLEGVAEALWLPLACDPTVHRPIDRPKIHDLCFVGHLFPGPRIELVELLQSRFPNMFIGQRFFKEMAETYSESRIVFNRSLENDVNMRVFEALGCGRLLLTNDLRGNGQSELFRDGVHLATYADADELVDKAKFYLENEMLREQIAAAGQAETLARHTYGHRMRTLLETVERRLARRSVAVPRETERLASDPQSVLTTTRGLTSIVLVTFNQLEYTRLCIDSVLTHTQTPFELVCVDNGSTDGTVDYLRTLAGATVVANGDNRGFPAAANQGIRAARGEQILLLNNDTVVTPGWLERMLAAFDHDPQVGLVGPCSNYCSGPQEIAVPYEKLDRIVPFADDWARVNAGQIVDIDRLVGFCLLFRRSVVDRIGLLDERFGIGNFEDDDFCRRAIAAGFRTVLAVDAFVHHFGSRTFFGSGVDLGQLLRENQRKYDAKWGEAPSLGSARSPDVAVPVTPLSAELKASAVSPPRPSFEIEAREGGGLLLRHRKVRLSLCMIVRDNETTIGPCLASIRPYVDEIIVVDTGSKDRTPEICREYGARLYQFPWCDDFSAARNESLKYAHGEWIFWMDSDDTISDDCGRRLRALAEGPHDPSVLGYILQVHCPGPSRDPLGGEDVTVVDHVKLIRNRPDLRFEGRIHEQLLPAIRRANGDVAWTDLYVVHSGSDHTAASWERKLERDLRILHQELKERPEHPFVLFNLGMTYADARRYGDAIDFLEKCLAVSRPEESHLRKAYSLLVSALSQAERHDEAWRRCEEGLALYPGDKELLFRSAILHHHFGRLDAAETAYLQVLNDSGERHFQSIDQGLAGYKARHNLALVYDDMGRIDAVETEWRRILEDQPDYVPAWRGLGDVLLRQQKHSEVEYEISRLLAGKNGLRREGLLLRGWSLASRSRVAAALDEFEAADAMDPGDLEALRAKCRLLFEQGAPTMAEEALQELTRRAPDDAAAWHNLGTVYFRQHRYPQAVEAFEKSLRIRPDSPVTHEQLGTARQQLNLNSVPARSSSVNSSTERQHSAIPAVPV